MTDYDRDVIEEWRKGFAKKRDVFGVQPDIWDRVQYLRDRGYRRFPHVQAVLGRRASKGLMGGVLGAEQVAYFYSLDDWQAHYGIDPGQDGYLNVFATSQSQAQRFQFADIRRTVENCKYLQSAISTSKEYYFSIRTPADVRKIAELKSAGVVVEREIATLKAIALSANSSSGRGAVSFANFFDEFAFLIQGTGSNKSDAEIYECLDPSTRVLCSDLVWRAIGDLAVGDKVVGYDEHQDAPGHGGRRRLRETEVLGLWHQKPGPTFRITFIDGTSVVCSPNHRWLRVNYRPETDSYNAPRWAAIDPEHAPTKRTTRPLRVGDHIKFLAEPWETDDTHDGGWLAGMYDGEGCIHATKNERRIGLSQTYGPVFDRAETLLKDFGFDIHIRRCENAPSRPTHWKPSGIIDIYRLEQCMRLLGQLRPTRLLLKQKALWEGRTIANAQVKTIASIVRIEDRVLVDIETGTGTFIAEGLVSHNSAQPSLDQFGKDALTYIPSSPFTKSGKCYELYRQGSIPMSSYIDREGILTENKIDIEADADEISADPEMLVFQGASWDLYRDWERGGELVNVRFKRPVQPDLTSEIQQRRKRRNPEKFKVEREGQWAEVESAYLDPDKVDEAFVHPDWREPLEPQDFGRVNRQYRIHCDPGRVNANFAMAVAHLEDMPPDEHGDVWPCAIFDYLKVWKPSDYLDHTIDYIEVEKEIKDVLKRFPSTAKISFDQWNSASFLANIRKEFSPNIRVVEEIATERINQARCEKFKSALNLGWMKTYLDHYGEDGNCLLEQELKFLTEKNGKVMKQDFGPCTTKDLFDAVSIVTTDLLHDALDRWAMKLATGSSYGSTDVAGMRSGRELDRLGRLGGGAMDRHGSLAREMLANHHTERARSNARMDREVGFPTRGRIRDHQPKPYVPSSTRKRSF